MQFRKRPRRKRGISTETMVSVERETQKLTETKEAKILVPDTDVKDRLASPPTNLPSPPDPQRNGDQTPSESDCLSSIVAFHDARSRDSLASRFCATCNHKYYGPLKDLISFEDDGYELHLGLWKDCYHCDAGVCSNCVAKGGPYQCCFSLYFVCDKCRLGVEYFRKRASITWFPPPIPNFIYHSGSCFLCLQKLGY